MSESVNRSVERSVHRETPPTPTDGRTDGLTENLLTNPTNTPAFATRGRIQTIMKSSQERRRCAPATITAVSS